MVDISQRLDAFTDAAFAFAVTLMVVGAGGAPVDLATLQATIASLPSFAIGFAIIAMFWFAHVRWRTYRGTGDAWSVLLTLLLIFVVLIYVTPLRAMANAFAGYLMGRPDSFQGGIGALFTVYGLGFTAMALLTALLFRDALRNPALANGPRREVRGQLAIWLILAGTGAFSTMMAMNRDTASYSPFLYATLPVTIGIFSARWRWDEPPEPEA